MDDQAQVDWVHTRRVLSYFQSPTDYRMFVESRRSEPLISPFEKAVGGAIFGDSVFVKQIREMIRGKAPTPEVPARKVVERWGSFPDVPLIRDLVDSTFPGLSPKRRNQLLGFALWKYTWLKGVEIAKVMGRTRSAVSHMARNMEVRMASDAAIASGVDALRLRLEEASRAMPPARVHPDDWLRKESRAPIRLVG